MYESSSSYLQAELDYRAARIRAGRGERRLRRIRAVRRPSEAATRAKSMSARVDVRDMMGPVTGHTSQTLIGRDAELAELAAMLGVRPEPGPHAGGRRAAVR